MSAIKIFSLAALLGLAGTVSATSFVVTTDAVVGAVAATSEATSDVSSSFGDDKVVLAARDDAAAFVASQGGYSGRTSGGRPAAYSSAGTDAARRRYATGDCHSQSLNAGAKACA